MIPEGGYLSNQLPLFAVPIRADERDGYQRSLIPEASRLAYVPPPEADTESLGDEKPPVVVEVELDNPFKPPTKVTAIETQAREYRHIYDIFMSDETRKRLNLN